MKSYYYSFIPLIMGSLVMLICIINIIVKIKKYKKGKVDKDILKLEIILSTFGCLAFFVMSLSVSLENYNKYKPVDNEKKDNKESKDINYCNDPDYRILIDEYDMTCNYYVEDEISNTVFKKDNFIFKINDKNIIEDNDPYNYLYHNYILSNYFNIPDGSFNLIIENLKDNYDHYERESSITVFIKNHQVSFRYNKGEIYIESMDCFYEVDNNKILNITHYDEDYYDFDEKLINILFDMDIDDFEISKIGNMIKYKMRIK